MGFTTGITIEGDKELAELLQQIPDRLLGEVAKGMRAVAKPIIANAKSRLKKGHGLETGVLKRSIGVRHLKAFRKENKVVMYVGPREKGFVTVVERKVIRNGKEYTYRRKHNPLKIAHLVEYGHRQVVNGKNYSAVKPRPFLRPAVDANRHLFLDTMKVAIWKVIKKRSAKGS